MRSLWTVLAALLVGILPAQEQRTMNQDRATLGTAQDLRILYAGKEGDPRTERFVAFLREWFTTVDTIGLGTLGPETAGDHDVVIADWTRLYVDGRPKLSSPGLTLSPDYTKPTILIASVAGSVTRQSGTKLDWL